MRNFKIIAAIGLIITSASLCRGQETRNPMLHAANGAVVNADGAPVQLRCANLSPWLDPEPYLIGKALRGLTRSPSELKQKLAEIVGPADAQAFWQQWEDTFITREDFARLKEQGCAPKDDLVSLYRSIIAAIREVDPDHIIVLEGDTYAHDFSFFPPPADSNLMYEFHEYSLLNSSWRTPNEKALEPFLKLRTATHVPLWLGEFGEETLDWQAQMVELMKTNQIGWAVWPWKRVGLDNGHPVIESITMPDAWEKLFRYLVGPWFSGRPSTAAAHQGMAQMLQAIRTRNCTEDKALAKILASQ